MKKRIFYVSLCLFIFILSCDSKSGYDKKDGKWKWKYYHGGNMKYQFKEIDSLNHDVFKVVSNNFGKDDRYVFYKSSIILNADPKTFQTIEKNYSKDKNHVFLDDEIVVFANPESFELLEFPYSKDNYRVFCGSLPLKLNKNEVKEFKVTNTDELMSGMKTSSMLTNFIKFNPEYKWLDTLNIKGVIYGEDGTGETLNKKIKGFKIIE